MLFYHESWHYLEGMYMFVTIFSEYLQGGECSVWIELSETTNTQHTARLMTQGEERGFPGVFRSIDFMHLMEELAIRLVGDV